jgi:hypothetical protein
LTTTDRTSQPSESIRRLRSATKSVRFTRSKASGLYQVSSNEVAGPAALWMKAAGKPVLLLRAFGADGKPTGGDEYLMP